MTYANTDSRQNSEIVAVVVRDEHSCHPSAEMGISSSMKPSNPESHNEQKPHASVTRDEAKRKMQHSASAYDCGARRSSFFLLELAPQSHQPRDHVNGHVNAQVQQLVRGRAREVTMENNDKSATEEKKLKRRPSQARAMACVLPQRMRSLSLSLQQRSGLHRAQARLHWVQKKTRNEFTATVFSRESVSSSKL